MESDFWPLKNGLIVQNSKTKLWKIRFRSIFFVLNSICQVVSLKSNEENQYNELIFLVVDPPCLTWLSTWGARHWKIPLVTLVTAIYGFWIVWMSFLPSFKKIISKDNISKLILEPSWLLVNSTVELVEFFWWGAFHVLFSTRGLLIWPSLGLWISYYDWNVRGD